MNGSVQVTRGRGGAGGDGERLHPRLHGPGRRPGPLSFKTVNGGITVELPASVAADVHAETVNGGIETDFPLTVKGKCVGRRIDGTIGAGGRRLELETVNGSITLRKAS